MDKKYSVLLGYPEWMTDGNTETYYAFVEAAGPKEAVAEARARLLKTQELYAGVPEDFAVLLVTEGHNFGLAWE
jgi:hypothetical protein